MSIPFLIEILESIGYYASRQFIRDSLEVLPMNLAHCMAIVIWGLSALMVFSLFKAAHYGSRLEEQNYHDQSTLRTHQRWAWRSFWVTLTTVIVIDPTLRLFNVPYVWFFKWVHLPLLISYGSFLILALVFDGLEKNRSPRFPRRHNAFGRLAQFCGLFTAITGDWLVFVLLWLPFQSALH